MARVHICKCRICTRRSSKGREVNARTLREHRITALSAPTPLPTLFEPTITGPDRKPKHMLRELADLLRDRYNKPPVAMDKLKFQTSTGPDIPPLDPCSKYSRVFMNHKAGLGVVLSRARTICANGSSDLKKYGATVICLGEALVAGLEASLRREWRWRRGLPEEKSSSGKLLVDCCKSFPYA